MNTKFTTDADIRNMVIEALGEYAKDFDIDAITAGLKAAADYDGRHFTNLPEGDEFWAIAQRHDTAA